jgi:DNA-binding response OmpR family regulator
MKRVEGGARRRPPTVLFVDADDDRRDRVALALLAAGYVPLLARTAKQAVTIVGDWSKMIDLVLVDPSIPESDGTRLGDECRRRMASVSIAGACRMQRLSERWSTQDVVDLAHHVEELPAAANA